MPEGGETRRSGVTSKGDARGRVVIGPTYAQTERIDDGRDFAMFTRPVYIPPLPPNTVIIS